MGLPQVNALVHQEARALGAAYSFDDMDRMAHVIAQSGLFGVKNPTQALALMLVAQAEGEHPASVAQDYDIIQGKGSRKTHSVLARFQAMGGKVDWHELSHTRAEATFSHPKGGSLRLDWTIEQAKNAGLVGKDNWKGYARAMLRARLIAEGVRAVFPAAIGGWQVPEEAMGPQLDQPPPPEKHMGAADVVQTPAPSPAPAPAVAKKPFPDESFASSMPAFQKAINKGKTPADVLATFEQFNPEFALTDAQRGQILALKAVGKAAAPADTGVTDATPKVTYAALADKLKAAADQDAALLVLDEARALPADQQADLQKAFDERFQQE